VANEILTEFNKAPIKWDSICTDANTENSDTEKSDTDDNGTENKCTQDTRPNDVNSNIAMPETAQTIAVPISLQTTAVPKTTQTVAVPISSQTVAMPETTQTIAVPAIRDRDLVATIFPSNSPMRSRPRQIIFTDGSAVSNGARNGGNKKDKSCRGGYAAVFVSGPLRGELLGNLDTSKMYASNIRAEGKALIAALKKCEVELNPPVVIDIYTDSEFWINMVLKYMPKWNASKFAEKENPDLTRELWGLWRRLTGKYKINLHHVYSHNKSGLRESADPKDKFKFEHNAHADALASEARRALNAGQEIWRTSRK
jgi:ribonuclease HI